MSARWRPALALAVGWGLLVAFGLLLRAVSTPLAHVDLHAVQSFAQRRTATLTALAHGLSTFGRIWVLAPIAIVVGLGAWWRWRRHVWAPLIAILGADLLQQTVKAIVARPRPPVHHLEHVTGTSFPSGHATETTALLCALVLVLPTGRGRWVAAAVALVLAAAVAVARVYLGVHYPTDVAAGGLLGAAWAGMSVRCCPPVPTGRETPDG